ncbi:MAG TPA: isoleucine--tRNA ligase, partial [Candidatus Fraserbacteria bacterium]|nr:isoleucine--tRNA ligase [Candidatus Fraserbacteria bacterium]
HVIVTGMGLNAQGVKMSKSEAGSGLDPMVMIDELGADTLRWYLYSSSAPWRDRVLRAADAAKVRHGFLNTLSNVYNFFALYASIDGFDPSQAGVQRAVLQGQAQDLQGQARDLPLLDRWLRSRLQGTISEITQTLDAYDVVSATQATERFVNELSNWYLRLSRSRFWGEGLSPDKLSGYATLYETLVTLCKLLAPFLPFLSESIYRQLGASEAESVHLTDWPQADDSLVDPALERQMALVRRIVSLGRAARNQAGIKVRQPLAAMQVQLNDSSDGKLLEALQKLVLDELNLKRLELTTENLRERHLHPQITPLMEQIGPKFGALAPKLKRALQEADLRQLAGELEDSAHCSLAVEGQQVELTQTELKLEYLPEPGAGVAFDETLLVVLDTRITPELRAEGYARELIRLVQEERKKAGYDVSDRITLFVQGEAELARAIEAHREFIRHETLTVTLHLAAPPAEAVDRLSELNLNGLQAKVGLKREE